MVTNFSVLYSTIRPFDVSMSACFTFSAFLPSSSLLTNWILFYCFDDVQNETGHSLCWLYMVSRSVNVMALGLGSCKNSLIIRYR